MAGVALLGLVAYQLPGLFGSSSGSGSNSAAPAAGVAVPVAHRAPAGSDVSTSPVPRSVARLALRDIFVPQVRAATTGAPPEGVGVMLKGPAVRTHHFVLKEPFIPQIKPPAASQSTSSWVWSAGSAGSADTSPGTTAGAGFIVVVASIPGIGSASQKAAARALVAAKNAGLKGRRLVANNQVPGEAGSRPHFTVYTGPYPAASAQDGAHPGVRNGYPHAHAQALPSSTGKGCLGP